MANDLELEQDVLLVSNEGSENLEVVSKVDENGELKTVAPAQANEADFLKFDKHSNMLESFLKNYFAQAKNPKHTGMYLVAASGIENLSQLIKGLVESGEEGKEFLSEYKVDTSKYEQQQSEQTTTQTTKSEYQPMDAESIDWAMFEKIGVKRETLEKSGALDDMLNYRRTSELHPITMKVDDLTLNTDARLSLRKSKDGRLIPVIHAVRKEPQLDRPYYGNTFTADDKENLRKTGNLGRVLELTIKGVDKKVSAYVSVDSKTNELIAYNTKSVRIPNEIKGVTLSEEQKRVLREGKGLYLEGMKSKSGKEFSATIQVNASERGLVFRFDEAPKQNISQANKQSEVTIPNKIGGVELAAKDREALKEGEVIYVKGMTDKRGEKYDAYIKVNSEMGKLNFYRWDPRKKQSVVTDNNDTTQLSVKSEDKISEEQKQQSRGRKM